MVNCRWYVDDSLSEFVTVKVKFKNASCTVAGLEDVETFDAFAGLSLTFSGTAPAGTVSLAYTGSAMTKTDFVPDKTSGLSNGDTVTVSLNGGVEHYIHSFGKIPASFEKQYTVEGLAEYVSSYDSLTADLIGRLHTEAEDIISTSVAQASGYDLTDLAYCGYALSIEKEIAAYTVFGNRLYILYSGTVSSPDGQFNACQVYFPVCFVNVIADNGTLQYGGNIGILGASTLNGTWHVISGYADPFDCYRELLDENRDTRSTVCGDGFENYAEQETITSLTDIDQSCKEALYADARDRILNYIESDYYMALSSDLVFEGEYLLIPKDQGANNRCVIVCSATVSPSDKTQIYEKFDPATVFFPVSYDNILNLPSGEYIAAGPTDILGSTFLDGGIYIKTAGYTDWQTMFTNVVTANRDTYTCEVSDGLKKFGE